MYFSTILQVGGGRKALFPLLDAHLMTFFKEHRQQNYAVSYKKIKNKIERVRNMMRLPSPFKASKSFIFCWTRRHNIASYPLRMPLKLTNAHTMSCAESSRVNL
jgi:hypothetical protein